MTQSIVLVGLGGGIGSISRYLITMLVQKNVQSQFPLSTFIVNTIGCLAIGILMGYFSQEGQTNSKLSLLFVTGFCGGYTTFSSFAYENIQLFQSGNTTTSFIYIGTSVVSCLLAVWLGLAIVSLFL